MSRGVDSPLLPEIGKTLVHAVTALGGEQQRGFVFVHPDATERFCSFAEIGREARSRAQGLLLAGVKKGDRVALILPEGDEFVLTFLGALFAGAVPVPIYPQLSFKNVEAYADTVLHIVRSSEARVLVTSKGTLPYVEPIREKLPELSFLLSDAVAAHEPKDTGVFVEPDDLAFLQFTSGSTSRPKGVMVTHANLRANAVAFMVHGLKRVPGKDKGVSWLPLFHDMGLIGFVVGPLFTNVECVFLPTASFVRRPLVWLETIHKHRGTITYAPNFAYALVAKRLKEKELATLDLSCLRVAGSGAEPISAPTLRAFAEKLVPCGFRPEAFLPSYGMAEATLAVTFTPVETGMTSERVSSKELGHGVARVLSGEGAQELVACGSPFPEHEVRIVDAEGNFLPDRNVGEIVTRGPSVMRGYFRDEELTRSALRPLAGGGDPWLFTGDLGYFANGRLYVCGRVKDIIIVRGRNYYPQDIEWPVGELEGVRRGAVVAFGAAFDDRGPSPDGAEELVVCAETMGGLSQDQLVAAISASVVANFALTPKEVVLVAQGGLPRTSSGKLQRRKTRQMFLDGTLPRKRSGEVEATAE